MQVRVDHYELAYVGDLLTKTWKKVKSENSLESSDSSELIYIR